MSAGFSDRQLKKLATPLDRARVQTREHDGKALSYIEGWFAISEANRIFGYDGWDREMVHFERVFERSRGEGTACGYVARVRVKVRAKATTVIREGTGFGHASAALPGDAHERALKAAETDATKRALATFGGRFGLLLYDKEGSGTGKGRNDRLGDGAIGAGPSGRMRAPGAGEMGIANERAVLRSSAGLLAEQPPEGPAILPSRSGSFALTMPDGGICAAETAEGFCSGLRQLIEAARDGRQLEELRRNNEATIRRLRGAPGLRTARGEHFADVLLKLFERRRRELDVRPAEPSIAPAPHSADGASRVPTPSRSQSPPSHAPRPAALGGNGPGLRAEVGAAPAVPADNLPGAAGDALPMGGPGPGDDVAADRAPESVDGANDAEVYGSTPQTTQGAGISEMSVSQAPRGAYGSFVPVPPYPLSAVLGVMARNGGAMEITGDVPTSASARGDAPGAANGVANGAVRDAPRADPAGLVASASPAPTRTSRITGAPSIDKSVLAIASDRRLRSKAHLAYVASKACAVCEEMPCHAHHVTFAQPRGLAQKVSDEFTVPLCVRHHNELHLSGSEIAWWRRQGIDPLPMARALWEETMGASGTGALPGAAADKGALAEAPQ